MIIAMLATPAGDNIIVELSGCVYDTPLAGGSCLPTLPYTAQQLRDVAVAVAHGL